MLLILRRPLEFWYHGKFAATFRLDCSSRRWDGAIRLRARSASMVDPSKADERSKAETTLAEIGDMLSNLGYTGDEAADFVRRHIAAKASSSRQPADSAAATEANGGTQKVPAELLTADSTNQSVGLEVPFDGDDYLEKYKQMQAAGPGGRLSRLGEQNVETTSNSSGAGGSVDLSGLVPRRRRPSLSSVKKRNTA